MLKNIFPSGAEHWTKSQDPKANETRSQASRSTVLRRNNRHQAFHTRRRAQKQFLSGSEEGVFDAAWWGVTYEELSLTADQVGDFRQKEPEGRKL